MISKLRISYLVLATCISSMALAAPTGAATRLWQPSVFGGYIWRNPANWHPEGYATDDNLVYLSQTSPFLQPAQADEDVITDNGGSILLDGPFTVADFRPYDLYVGEVGAARMDIVNAADVANDIGYIGYVVGAEGIVTVSGNGSTWTNDYSLIIGNLGTGRLTIADGGAVSNLLGYIAHESAGTGDVSVTGPGSTWVNHSTLTVGLGGSGSLAISAGGKVSNFSGYVGYESGSAGHVTVNGTGSQWDNAGPLLRIGHNGYGGLGTLAISAGGLVSSQYTGVENGAAIVSGAGSRWVVNGQSMGVSSLSGTATLSMTDGGTVVSEGGGVGLNSSDTSGEVSINGAGSQWINSGSLYVGSTGAGRMTLTEGGAASNLYGYLAFGSSALAEVDVSGVGSTWTNQEHLSVGHRGAAQLNITDGGVVTSGRHRLIGWLDNADGNVIVSGTGSTLSCGTYNLYLGGGQYWDGTSWSDGGTGSGRLTVLDGGVVTNAMGFLGYNTGAYGEVAVSGANSHWENNGELNVGHYGTGKLTIDNGGTLDAVGLTYIGRYPNASGDVLVNGVGSTWQNNANIYVGSDGTGTLTISGGGTVQSPYGNIADKATGWGLVTVTGAGSSWTAAGGMFVGQRGAGTLSVTDGGAVASGASYVGRYANSLGQVTISGHDSTWDVSGALNIAYADTGMLAISAGGKLTNTSGYIGRLTGTAGTVTVDGVNSRWINSGSLSVGREGTGTLEITDGGSVSNTDGYVGYLANSSGDVTIRGAGSTWFSSGNLTVGRSGAGTLTIRDGAAVTSNGTLRIAEQGTSTAAVTLEGGSLTAASLTTGAGVADFVWTGGALSITGPGGLTLHSGLLGPVIGIHANKTLHVAGTTTVSSGVTLAVTGGEFATDTLSVSGIAQLRSGAITLGDTFAVNADGQLEITGQDLALLTAPSLAGQLALDQTTLTVPTMTISATASVDLDSGLVSSIGILDNQGAVRIGNTGAATLRALQLQNSGSILGRGVFQAEVVNQGNIGISGNSSFTEDVANQPGGKIIISGGAAGTFFEDVDNALGAEIRVSANCAATYFGSLNGLGSFSGGGTSYIEGDMRPGASPGILTFRAIDIHG